MIRFDRESHTYTKDGVVLPSVTQILSWLYPNKYDGIPERILQEKADYGTRVHEAVEHYALTGRRKQHQSDLMKLSTKQAYDLLNGWRIDIEHVEQIVHYKSHYAGTYDMLGVIEKDPVLIDIKTTADLDEEYLSWQLGMYALALKQQGILIKQHLCLWLPKGTLAKMVEITPKDQDEIEWMVYRYETEHCTEG